MSEARPGRSRPYLFLRPGPPAPLVGFGRLNLARGQRRETVAIAKTRARAAAARSFIVPQWGHQAPPWQALMTQGHRAQRIKLKKSLDVRFTCTERCESVFQLNDRILTEALTKKVRSRPAVRGQPDRTGTAMPGTTHH